MRVYVSEESSRRLQKMARMRAVSPEEHLDALVAADDVENMEDRPQAEKDARGQSESAHKGGSSNGMTSADPRTISGNEDGDATFPLDQTDDKGSGQ